MKFRVVLQFDPASRGWSAICPDMPGCVSAGDTESEARRNITEAIRGYLTPCPLDLPHGAKLVAVTVA